MSLFHDEEDGTPREPIPGLPQALPEGELVLWQGRPTASAFALHVFHLRFVVAYFALSAGIRLVQMAGEGASAAAAASVIVQTSLTCALAISVLYGLAALMVRSTMYTITSQRVVIRFGVAIRKYINLPFSQIASAALKPHGNRAGDIAFNLNEGGKLGWLHLWPHVRPFRLWSQQPMLRAIAEPQTVAARLIEAIQKAAPEDVAIKTAEQGQILAPPQETPTIGTIPVAIRA
ncbi:MAG: photosynthetic complex putative assembly protein PuhB [Pseudomonadota bacterium]